LKKFKCIVRYNDGIEKKCKLSENQLEKNVDIWLMEIQSEELFFLQISEIKK